jgi:hypothetical protein
MFSAASVAPGILCFKVGDCFVGLVQVHVTSTDVSVRPTLPREVAHLLYIRQAMLMVLNGLAKVPLRTIRDSEVNIRHAPSIPRSPTSCSIHSSPIPSRPCARVKIWQRSAAARTWPLRKSPLFARCVCVCVYQSRRLLRCKNATRSAVHESGATPSLTTSRHLLSTPQMSLCRPINRLPPNAAFFEAIFW